MLNGSQKSKCHPIKHANICLSQALALESVEGFFRLMLKDMLMVTVKALESLITKKEDNLLLSLEFFMLCVPWVSYCA